MADEPIQFRRTANPHPLAIESADGTTVGRLREGEPAIAIAPGNTTKLWIGDGVANRLLLSTDRTEAPLLTAGYAPLDSPVLTGTPTAPTATAGTSTTQVATTEFVERDFLPLAGDASVTLTVGSLAAEEITLDGTPLVTTTGGNAGDVLTKQPDESIAWARIGDPNGLVIGNPTGGALGTGTLNIQGEIYQDGELFEPGGAPPQIVWGMINGSMSNQADLQAALHAAGVSFAQSFAWTAGVEPNNVCLYINNSGQELSIRAVTGAIEVDNGVTAEVRVVRAAPGNPLTTGPGQDVADPFDLEQSVGTVETLDVLEPVLLPDWRLGLRTSGNWQNSVATITVHLGPPVPTAAPYITSPPEHRSEVNLPFSYQIIALGATNFTATVPPPAGLTVNAATGLISGTPTAAGITNVTIGAYNAAGGDSKPLQVTITEPPTRWDPARAGSPVYFEDANMTFWAGGGFPYKSCLSTTTRPIGRWYIEATLGEYGGVGFATDLPPTVAMDGNSSLGRGWSVGGQRSGTSVLFFRGTDNVTTYGGGAPALPTPMIIAMAIDVAASLIWFRDITTDLDSPWSNEANFTGPPFADPATGTRGIPVTPPFLDWINDAGGRFHLIATSGQGGRATLNPGPTTKANPPQGFFRWDS